MLEYNEHILPYKDIHFIEDCRGYIAWRSGTGNSVELLHIAASEHRQGYGRKLFADMLYSISCTDAYTVFGFTRARLVYAQLFYIALGFKLKRVPGLYVDGDGVMFHQTLNRLMEIDNAQ